MCGIGNLIACAVMSTLGVGVFIASRGYDTLSRVLSSLLMTLFLLAVAERHYALTQITVAFHAGALIECTQGFGTNQVLLISKANGYEISGGYAISQSHKIALEYCHPNTGFFKVHWGSSLLLFILIFAASSMIRRSKAPSLERTSRHQTPID